MKKFFLNLIKIWHFLVAHDEVQKLKEEHSLMSENGLFSIKTCLPNTSRLKRRSFIVSLAFFTITFFSSLLYGLTLNMTFNYLGTCFIILAAISIVIYSVVYTYAVTKYTYYYLGEEL